MRALPRSTLLLAFGLAACGGSQRAADAEWNFEAHEEKPHRVRDTIVLNPTPLEKQEPSRAAFVGVRHDLMLSNAAPKEARCSCLAVQAAGAQAPVFFWQGDRPHLGPESIVVAIGAQGVACPGGDPDESRRRPSISAVDLENDRVVIEVEDLPEGRPLASGAIVPRPGPGGLFIRPRNARTIYGRGPGGGLCRVL